MVWHIMVWHIMVWHIMVWHIMVWNIIDFAGGNSYTLPRTARGTSRAGGLTVSGSYEEENARLRARVRELEFELRQCRTGTGAASDDEITASLLRRLPGRAVDETNRLVRSTILAIVEQLRASADNITRFTDEVFLSNRGESAESVAGLAFSLPHDINSAWIRMLDRSLNIPSLAVRRFWETYQHSSARQEGATRIILEKTEPPRE